MSAAAPTTYQLFEAGAEGTMAPCPSSSEPPTTCPAPPVSWQPPDQWKQEQVFQGPSFTGYRPVPAGYPTPSLNKPSSNGGGGGGSQQGSTGGFHPALFSKIQEFQLLAKLGAIQENYLANAVPRSVLQREQYML